MTQTTEAQTRLDEKQQKRMEQRRARMEEAKAKRDQNLAAEPKPEPAPEPEATPEPEPESNDLLIHLLQGDIAFREAELAEIRQELAVLQPGKSAPKKGTGEPCVCGCGFRPVKKTSRFAPGHDQRCKGWISRAVASGTVDELDERVQEYGRERGML